MERKGPIEVALSTDLRGEPYYFSLWDVHSGAQLVVFKGNKGSPIARCLQFVDNNYFITATDNVLQIWSIYNRKCQEQKLFLPARPSCLCITPCGNYLVAGIAEKMYVWQLKSGNLLAHNQKHYQAITVLKTNQDGTFLFSGGDDGLVLVWPFADLISSTHNTGALNISQTRTDVGVNEPRFTWQHHGSKVTDIHVANGGRCITTSIDKTVNIYSYADGKRLYCIANWPSPIWCVAMNKNETRVFLGGQDGSIYELSVSSLSLSLINSRDKAEEASRKPIFVGHKDKVTSLVISTDGSMLISGSLDSTCKVWDINQGKMLRDVKHQASIANLCTLLIPDAFSLASMTQSMVKPPLSVKPLKRNPDKFHGMFPANGTVAQEDLFEEASTTMLYTTNKMDYSQYFAHPVPSRENFRSNDTVLEKLENGTSLKAQPQERESGMNKEVQQLKSRLQELYRLSAEKIFQDVATESLELFKKEIDLNVEPKQKEERIRKSDQAKKRKGKGDSGKLNSGAVQQQNGVKKAKKV